MHAGDALYLQPAEEGLPLYIAELLGLAEDAHGGKSAEVRCGLRRCRVCAVKESIGVRLAPLTPVLEDDERAGRSNQTLLYMFRVYKDQAALPNFAQAPGLSSLHTLTCLHAVQVVLQAAGAGA